LRVSAGIRPASPAHGDCAASPARSLSGVNLHVGYGRFVAWSWRYENASGEVVDPAEAPPGDGFPTQSDAETWLGENWRELLSTGVEQVSLLDGTHVVYGGMSLRPPD